MDFKLTSSAFENNGPIPAKYTCDGEGINPPLTIENIPDGTQSLALIVEDPDAPNGTYDHWIVWNIDPVSHIRENSIPGISGRNSNGVTGYHPPCPPSGSHRYIFKLYALSARPDLQVHAAKSELLAAMKDILIDETGLTGIYRPQ